MKLGNDFKGDVVNLIKREFHIVKFVLSDEYVRTPAAVPAGTDEVRVNSSPSPRVTDDFERLTLDGSSLTVILQLDSTPL